MGNIILSQRFDAPVDTVWKALSEEANLKEWYFDVQNYIFQVGTEFSFYEEGTAKQFLHVCKFLEIIPLQRISHTWTHPQQSQGSSILTWDLEDQGDKTLVTLTHAGVENFADAGPAFAPANFEMGWNAILKTNLRNYLYGIKKLVFDLSIQATPEQLWHTLWHAPSYTQWTEPFCAGTHYIGDVKQVGSRVHFLSPSGEGMYSDILFYKESELLIIKHIGMLKDKLELPMDEATEKWTGCFETYKVTRTAENTSLLRVEVDTVPEYIEYMNTTFTTALQKLKTMAESSAE